MRQCLRGEQAHIQSTRTGFSDVALKYHDQIQRAGAVRANDRQSPFPASGRWLSLGLPTREQDLACHAAREACMRSRRAAAIKHRVSSLCAEVRGRERSSAGSKPDPQSFLLRYCGAGRKQCNAQNAVLCPAVFSTALLAGVERPGSSKPTMPQDGSTLLRCCRMGVSVSKAAASSCGASRTSTLTARSDRAPCPPEKLPETGTIW